MQKKKTLFLERKASQGQRKCFFITKFHKFTGSNKVPNGLALRKNL